MAIPLNTKNSENTTENTEKNLQYNNVLDFNHNCPINTFQLFNGFTPEQYELVHDIFHGRKKALKNSIIVKEKDWAQDVYFIVSGTVQIHKNNEVVNTVKNGSVIGETALMNKGNSQRTATVVALTDVSYYPVSAADFFEIFKQDTSLHIKVLENLAQILHKRCLVMNNSIKNLKRFNF